MTMSWTRFASSTLSWSDKRLRDKIVKLFAETSPQHRPVYTFNHLYQVVKPTNATQLAMVLTELVKSGVLRQFVRVESPETHSGIGDYSSITEVPSEIHDESSDTWRNIRPENLRVMYARHD